VDLLNRPATKRRALANSLENQDDKPCNAKFLGDLKIGDLKTAAAPRGRSKIRATPSLLLKGRNLDSSELEVTGDDTLGAVSDGEKGLLNGLCPREHFTK
jgi:hypothetical protein